MTASNFAFLYCKMKKILDRHFVSPRVAVTWFYFYCALNFSHLQLLLQASDATDKKLCKLQDVRRLRGETEKHRNC